MSDVRHFEALVDVADEDGAAFPALVTVTATTVAIQAFDIEIASWPVSEVSVVPSDDGVLIEVPGSLLCVRTDDDDLFAASFAGGAEPQVGVA